MQMIICRGAPGSGKSTWAHQIAPTIDAVVVNRDDVRRQIDLDESEPTGYPWPKGKKLGRREERVTEICHAAMRTAFENGHSVICDDTNLTDRAVNGLKGIAEEYGADVSFNNSFLDVPLDVLYKQNAARRYSVPEHVVFDMYCRTVAIRGLTVEPDRSLPECVIVDVDGTLAHMEGRSPFDWARVGEDSLDEPTAAAVAGFRNRGYKIVVLTGRDGSCEMETRRWLADHDVMFDDLFIRAAGDMRKDSVIKEELLRREVLPKYCPVLAVDDRRQMYELWRSLGIRTWAVDTGNF